MYDIVISRLVLNAPSHFFTDLRSPRRLPVPGGDLGNVYCLRAPEEAHAIAATADGKDLVIVGSSFIGTPG